MIHGFALLMAFFVSANAQWGRFDNRGFYIHLRGPPVTFEDALDACEQRPDILGRLWAPRSVEGEILTYVKRTLIPDLSKYGELCVFPYFHRLVSWDLSKCPSSISTS